MLLRCGECCCQGGGNDMDAESFSERKDWRTVFSRRLRQKLPLLGGSVVELASYRGRSVESAFSESGGGEHCCRGVDESM